MSKLNDRDPESRTRDSAQTLFIDTDVRMVVADMDGTLLDENSRIPDELWPLLGRMHEQGILFVPASGRQYATLASMFDQADTHEMPFIAENGGYVLRGGREIASTTLDRSFVATVTDLVRRLVGSGHDLGIVICGKRSAYVERHDEAFLAEARNYYVALGIVDDVLANDDDIVKVAIFDFGDAERSTIPPLERFGDTHRVVLSGKHWVDVMPPQVNKGQAVRALQAELGISHEQTAAFGDYLNDAEMLDAAGFSFAVANAHPDILARARFVIPANTEHGVITTLEQMLRR